MTIRELLDKRANLISQAREILELAETETRAVSDEEQTRWDALMDEVNDLTTQIERKQQMLEAEQRGSQLATQHGDPEPGDPQGDPDPDRRGDPVQLDFESREMRQLGELVPEWREEPLWRGLFPFADDGYRTAFDQALRRGPQVMSEEHRALQVDVDVQGGYLATPMQFVDRLLKGIDDLVYIRQWATVFPVPSAQSLGAPSLDADPEDGTWTPEIGEADEDTQMAFGRRELYPHQLAKLIKVSKRLIRMMPSAEALVRERLSYKFAVTMEKNFLTGNGAEQPLGVFTASDQGISTGRDISTDNTTTAFTADGLIEAKFALKGGYWPNARWMFHRDGVKMAAKLKDSDGQYLWRESIRVGEPDRLLNLPLAMSEHVPNTFTTGNYVGIVGDFSYYWIADALNMQIQVLRELYARTNQDGFIGRLESDGMPVLEEAFARVTLA